MSKLKLGLTLQQQTDTVQVVQGIGKAAELTVKGSQMLSEYLSKKIEEGGGTFKKYSKPCEEPTPISETTKTRVRQARDLSRGAAAVAHATIGVVADATSKAAGLIVDGINSRKDQACQNKPPSSFKKVGTAAVVAAVDTWEALEAAFRTVAKSSAAATSDMIEHKYGKEAGKVSYEGMSAAGNAADAVLVARHLGTKMIAKSTAKKVAVGVVTGSKMPKSEPGKSTH